MSLWVVRAGKNGEGENYALDESVVVVGWAELPDLSHISSRNELLPLLQDIYPDKKPNTLKNWESQLWAFTNRINVDDIVALPLKLQSGVAFARITGSYCFKPDAPGAAMHQCPVEWLKTVPLSKIDIDIRHMLGGLMTVFGVKQHNAEVRIKALLEGKTHPHEISSGIEKNTNDASDENADAGFDLETYAADQIIDFIGRKFRGHDLAHLVADVLRAQGYSVRVSPLGADGGVDIVAGRGLMGFDTPRLCIQVKSGDSPADVSVFRELQGVLNRYGAEHGLIVSWGGFTQPVIREARESYFQIRLWDQADLVHAVQDAYDRLDEQIQAKIPLKRAWILVAEED